MKGANGASSALNVELGAEGEICMSLPHSANGYAVVTIGNGAARTLEAHLYDQGPGAGFKIAGLARR
jgi:hypothetical protein